MGAGAGPLETIDLHSHQSPSLHYMGGRGRGTQFVLFLGSSIAIYSLSGLGQLISLYPCLSLLICQLEARKLSTLQVCGRG